MCLRLDAQENVWSEASGSCTTPIPVLNCSTDTERLFELSNENHMTVSITHRRGYWIATLKLSVSVCLQVVLPLYKHVSQTTPSGHTLIKANWVPLMEVKPTLQFH